MAARSPETGAENIGLVQTKAQWATIDRARAAILAFLSVHCGDLREERSMRCHGSSDDVRRRELAVFVALDLGLQRHVMDLEPPV